MAKLELSVLLFSILLLIPGYSGFFRRMKFAIMVLAVVPLGGLKIVESLSIFLCNYPSPPLKNKFTFSVNI